jgi:protein-S-isoprenylcysteine O-methyltransferase Ste14
MASKKAEAVAGAFTPVSVIFLLGLIAGVIGNFFVPFQIAQDIWIRLIGAIPLVVGIYLFASARRAFRRHLTPLMVWKPTTELVQDGPYRFARNPIYLAFALWCLATSFVFDSAYLLIILVIIVILFDRTQIPRRALFAGKIRRGIHSLQIKSSKMDLTYQSLFRLSLRRNLCESG